MHPVKILRPFRALGIMAFAAFAGLEMPSEARAVELIPAVGVTRTVEGDNSVDFYGSLGLRGEISPFLIPEIGVAYRAEERSDDVNVRMWPVTASLWLQPTPSLYVGGGAGWYHTTLDVESDATPPTAEEETFQDFGVHLGGGLRIPMGNVSLDLNGRYVLMQDQESELIPDEFDPDFWSLAAGLGFRF
jgi:hypothetical protein